MQSRRVAIFRRLERQRNGGSLAGFTIPGSAGVSPATSAGTAARSPHEEIALPATDTSARSFASLRSQTAGETPALPGRWRERIWMIAADGMMMAVPMSGGAFESPKALFKTRMLTGLIQSGIDYDVTADGQRFLIGTKVGDPMPVTVFLNWTAGLKK